MATTRLRHTFKYPSDDQDLDHDIDLDETSQDALLANLKTTSQTTDTLYIRIFSTIPLLCIPFFLFFLFRPSSSPPIRFISFLSITSLLTSSLAMYMTPVGEDGRVQRLGVLQVPGLGRVDSDGPLAMAVPVLNPVLCGLVALAGWGMWRRSGDGFVPEGFWLFCLVPGVVLFMVVVVKRSIREVEEGIGELDKLRYGLKGA